MRKKPRVGTAGRTCPGGFVHLLPAQVGGYMTFDKAQFLCAHGAYAVTPKWNHKAIVEQIRQSLRHSDSTINGTMAGEQSACA